MRTQFARRIGLYSLLLLVSAGLVLCFVTSDVVGAESSMSKEQAIRTALSITGLSEQKQIKATAVEESLAIGDRPAFIRLTGRPVWRVSLSDVNLTLHFPASDEDSQKPGHEGSGGRTFTLDKINSLDIVLDKETGKLVRISSPPVEGHPTVLREEKSLKSSSERYVGLPDDPPGITFLEALKSSPGCAISARQITAFHVMYQTEMTPEGTPHGATDVKFRDSPGAIWAITFTDVPNTRGPSSPRFKRPSSLDMRYFIDASTGHSMGGESVQ